jgi:hypothetical protein
MSLFLDTTCESQETQVEANRHVERLKGMIREALDDTVFSLLEDARGKAPQLNYIDILTIIFLYSTTNIDSFSYNHITREVDIKLEGERKVLSLHCGSPVAMINELVKSLCEPVDFGSLELDDVFYTLVLCKLKDHIISEGIASDIANSLISSVYRFILNLSINHSLKFNSFRTERDGESIFLCIDLSVLVSTVMQSVTIHAKDILSLFVELYELMSGMTDHGFQRPQPAVGDNGLCVRTLGG